MHARFPKYVLVLLFAAAATTAACSDDDDGAPTAPSARPTAIGKTVVAADRSSITPDFIPHPSCAFGAPFGLRIVITVGAGHDVLVRRLRFTLLDRLGGSAVPIGISPLAGSAPFSFPSSGPLPTPGALTIPSTAPIAIPSGASRTFPFFLEFGCGVPAGGTLVVTVDTTDGDGDEESAEVKIQVGN